MTPLPPAIYALVIASHVVLLLIVALKAKPWFAGLNLVAIVLDVYVLSL